MTVHWSISAIYEDIQIQCNPLNLIISYSLIAYPVYSVTIWKNKTKTYSLL